MTYAKWIPVTFIAAAVTLTGLTVATAQTDQSETDLVQAHARDGGRDGHRPGRGGHRGGMMFDQIMQQIDADGDGALTQPEVDAFRAAQVGAADASGDGSLSLEEFQTVFDTLSEDQRRQRMVRAFQRLDSDGDGSVTQAEMDAVFGDIVNRMDRNEDGQLDQDDRRGRGKRG